MTRCEAAPKLHELIADDLVANTGRSGFLGGISAFITDPSFSTAALHRIVFKTRAIGLVFLSKLIWRFSVALSGCHIHPTVEIGRSLRLPHPTGIVVGVGSRIGGFVTIYQNVTLGRSIRDGGYPIVGDGATIYPNSVVIGGITIGARSVVGAGSIVLTNVPDDAVVAGNPARLLSIVADAKCDETQ